MRHEVKFSMYHRGSVLLVVVAAFSCRALTILLDGFELNENVVSGLDRSEST